jgi:hypothetical protein
MLVVVSMFSEEFLNPSPNFSQQFPQKIVWLTDGGDAYK